MAIQVFLLDDHEVVRRGVRTLLESDPGLHVVGEAETVEEALVAIPATRPDVAILDARLPDGSGVTVCREVRSAHPEIACIMLTSFADDEALFESIVAGASGYLLKQVGGPDLIDAVKTVAAGGSLLDPGATERVVERLRHPDPGDDRLRVLTHQELVVLGHIGHGLTNRQIAVAMGLADKTVKNYVSNVLSKLGLERRSEAAAISARAEERRRRLTDW